MRRKSSTVVLAGVASVALGLAACSSSQPASEPSPDSSTIGSIPGMSQSAIDVMNSAPYSGSTWAIQVSDAKTGESLVSYNSTRLLEPASVTKTYSVGSAWLKFGPDSRIVTPVVRAGKISGKTLKGNLILVAKGDITMGGQTGPDGKIVFTDLDHNDANAIPGATIADNDPLAGLDDLAEQVKKSGISEVDGQVIIDDRLFVTQDLGEEDGPVSPIVINNNLIDFVTTPTTPGQLAKVEIRPEVAPWRLVNRVKTLAAGGDSEIAIDSPRDGVVRLRGTIAADSDPVLKVWHFDDPAAFARTAFIEALQRDGVSVTASATGDNPAALLPSEEAIGDRPEVAKLKGLTFEQNATYILKVSYNRGAQTQVCLLAVSVDSKNCDAGFPEMARLLAAAGVDPRNASLIDGSGLPGNYVTAQSSAQLMQAFAARPDAERWQQALPIMGVDGSIATVQKDSPAKGQVFAKTGTLANADLLNDRLRLETKALGGYIIAKSGRKLAVSIIMNQAMFDDIQGVFAANEDLGKIATSIYESF